MSAFVRIPAARARETAERAAACLAADPRVQLVFLFGSAADLQRASVRDVDLAVLSAPSISFDELQECRADLMKDGAVGIDLLSLNDASVVLAHEVADTGRCFLRATLMPRSISSHRRERAIGISSCTSTNSGASPANGSRSEPVVLRADAVRERTNRT